MKHIFFRRAQMYITLLLIMALAMTIVPVTSKASSEEDVQKEEQTESGGYILSYTREEDDTIMGRSGQKAHGMYQSAVTDSMHLAYSRDGKNFEALNYNTGVLFAKNKGTQTKGIKQPYIFRMKDGSFGVLAVRTNEEKDGEEEIADEDKGKLIFFTSKDLLSYKEIGMLTVSDTDTVKKPECTYDKESDRYYIRWTSKETGEDYINETLDFSSVGEKKQQERTSGESILSDIPYAIESNMIAVTLEESEKILNKLKPIVNTSVEEAQVEVTCGRPRDLSGVRVKANYSDGSQTEKSVIWNKDDLANVDFNKLGTYKVTGTVNTLGDKISKSDNYPFIAGNADPNIVFFHGKYYFIATNESGNLNFYIREADTVTGLKTAKKSLIYDEAKGKEGNIVSKSNHWAPELHVINNELYMFFATNVGTGWDVQCAIMKLKTGGNPTVYADWEAPKRYLDNTGKNLSRSYGGITLDMTHFSYNNRHYVIWSQRNFSKNGGTADLWIGETTAENPGKLISKAVKIVPCEYGWERNHEFVTEGPNVIMAKDKLYLTYSGGATDETYCVGMTQIDLSDNVDFLDADAWKKTNYPLLTGFTSRGENKYHGPGHNSYVTDEDGNLINVFHARPGDGTDFKRDAFLRVVQFGVDGEPILDIEEEAEVLPENRAVTMMVIITDKIIETPTPIQTATPVPTATPTDTPTDIPTQIPTGGPSDKPTQLPTEKAESTDKPYRKIEPTTSPVIKKLKFSPSSKKVKAGKKLKLGKYLKITKKRKGSAAFKYEFTKKKYKKYASLTKKGVLKTKKKGRKKTIYVRVRALDGSKKTAKIKIKIR